MSKPRGEGPSPPFSIAPKSFPDGPFMTVPILGCPYIEASYLSLANQSPAWNQAEWSKEGRGNTPAREISFVSLVLMVSFLSLSHGEGGGTASETRQGSSQQLTPVCALTGDCNLGVSGRHCNLLSTPPAPSNSLFFSVK